MGESLRPAAGVTSPDASAVYPLGSSRGESAARGLSGVEIITGDARSTGLPAGSFDLVHARTLLVNLPEPAEAAAEIW